MANIVAKIRKYAIVSNQQENKINDANSSWFLHNNRLDLI